MSQSYETLNNIDSTAAMLSIACLDWGVNPNFGGMLAPLCPASSAATDNGNLKNATYKSGGPGYSSLLSFTQSYAYDKVNRLTSASDTGGWSRGFGYDPNGNMWVTSNSWVPLAGNTPTSNVYTTANQIAGTPYDAAGNTGHVNGNGLVYDAEGRVIEVDESSGSEKLVYDGLGQRVQKTLPSGTTAYVYDAFGQLAAEYTTTPQTSAPCTTCYLSTDHLGSTRLVTDQSGSIVARHDFLPFGEEIAGGTAGRDSSWGSTTDVTQKFTGQVRDQETGMDFFNARYFGAAIGRFTSVDPGNAGADLYNPQSWNGYGYVGNNPLALVDPTGMSWKSIQIQVCSPLVSTTVYYEPTPAPPGSGNMWQCHYETYNYWADDDGPGTRGGHPNGPGKTAQRPRFRITFVSSLVMRRIQASGRRRARLLSGIRSRRCWIFPKASRSVDIWTLSRWRPVIHINAQPTAITCSACGCVLQELRFQ
jgi:RHS repeat-associated protein